MSDSYPTIQDSLSDMQKEFMGCVEMHVEPPELDSTSYRVDALYRCVECDLPADAIRFTVAVDESDPDISERRHMIEFLSLDGGEPRPVGGVLHSMKRIEASQGRYFWTESQFRVAAPEFPPGLAPQEKVEEEVKTYVDRVRALDRARRLVELT